eukprot:TRINITY_DN142292_c0_g1_i1.p3 TRINITY_DN142292_c0_g1~~TRINITY_DN142292_c0_g1_i1.p3  ORF type:complete len:132 (+),score=8.57 TRINITY_DN142292_c0_g1_i1:196-591(+)
MEYWRQQQQQQQLNGMGNQGLSQQNLGDVLAVYNNGYVPQQQQQQQPLNNLFALNLGGQSLDATFPMFAQNLMQMGWGNQSIPQNGQYQEDSQRHSNSRNNSRRNMNKSRSGPRGNVSKSMNACNFTKDGV